jgi:hypothetical protein
MEHKISNDKIGKANKNTDDKGYIQRSKLTDGTIYIDVENFNIDNVSFEQYKSKSASFEKYKIKGKEIQFYNIKYSYSEQIKDNLRLFCTKLSLQNSRNNIKSSRGYYTLEYEKETMEVERLQNILQSIKKKYIEYIVDQNNAKKIEMDEEYLDNYKDSIVPMIVDEKKVCRIIKLGSKSENNTNTVIDNIDVFSKVINDWKYNNKKTGSRFLVDIILNFTACTFCNIRQQRVSIKSYVQLIQIRHNKAICNPIIKKVDQISLDNELIL